jgi:CDGSH-type Zn-finger protein
VRNVIRMSRDGPLVATGDVVVGAPSGPRGLPTAVLCRCGRSADKPFCDGAHVRHRFEDPARLPPEPAVPSQRTPADATGDRLVVTPMPHGPLRCEGAFVVRDLEGHEEPARSPKLCRCGASQTRPYCDGTHRRIGFDG